MKSLKLKIALIGISLLSINTFAQDYIYQGVKNIDATIGMNNNKNESEQETISADCYDPANIGQRISAQGCEGLLIVDNTMLRNMILNQDIKTPENNYSDTNIFTGQVTNISFLFDNYSIKGTGKNPLYSISKWDVSNVTSMHSLFRKASFNQNIENWDVSNVKIMTSMFRESNFNQPLNNWSLLNVENTSAMFAGNYYFNQPLNNWDFPKIKDMNNMFSNTNFNSSLSGWDFSNNQPDLVSMFRNSSFNQNIKDWCVLTIYTEPDYFSSGGDLIEDNKPIWGTCPE